MPQFYPVPYTSDSVLFPFQPTPNYNHAGLNRGDGNSIVNVSHPTTLPRHGCIFHPWPAPISFTDSIHFNTNKILGLYKSFNDADHERNLNGSEKRELFKLITNILNIPNTQEELKKISPAKLADLANILGKFSTNRECKALLGLIPPPTSFTDYINSNINEILRLYTSFNYADHKRNLDVSEKQELFRLITNILNISNKQDEVKEEVKVKEELKKIWPAKLADLANILGKFNTHEECKALLGLIVQNIADDPTTLTEYKGRGRALLANACGKCLNQAYCKKTLEHIGHYENSETLQKYNLQGLALLATAYNKYHRKYPDQTWPLEAIDRITRYVCDNPTVIMNANPYGRALLAFAISPYADRQYCGEVIDHIAKYVCDNRNPPTEYHLQELGMLVSAFNEGFNEYPNQAHCLKAIGFLATYIGNDSNTLMANSLQDWDKLETVFKQHSTLGPTLKAMQEFSNIPVQDLGDYHRFLNYQQPLQENFLSDYPESSQENPRLHRYSKLVKQVNQALTADSIQAECQQAADRITQYKQPPTPTTPNTPRRVEEHALRHNHVGTYLHL